MNDQSGKIIVSACMMVKNEQANIFRCLKSIKGIVDEIVIIDTGSEDKTIEIAESFGARVFKHPWQNDFSLHRNQSIEYARGEWVFIIDADEELVITRKTKDLKDDKDVLRHFCSLVGKTHEVAGIPVKDIQKGNAVMQFNSSRLFKRGTIHYEGIVHNAPITKSNTSVLCEWAHIRHYGYDLTPDQKEAKFARTNGLLRKRIEDNPEDFTVAFYLCQLHAEAGRDNKEALIWGERYLAAKEAIKKTGNNFNHSIYFTLFRLNLHAGNLERAKTLLQEAIEEFGGDLDIALGIVEYGIATEDPDVILEGCGGFIHHWEEMAKSPTATGNKFIYSYRPDGLAYILFNKALTHFVLGARAVEQMIEVLNKLPPAVKNGFIADFQRKLADAGVPLQINFEGKEGNEQSPEMNIVSANIE